EIDPINGTDPITGTAEPGSTVTVTFPDGTTATVVAGPDGSWTCLLYTSDAADDLIGGVLGSRRSTEKKRQKFTGFLEISSLSRKTN
ncbi:Ig-like domain-containing protein, partial [Acinetobacter baumannii]|nr:Ig-like domain-containing protein [Acinetobacter baumannii]